jgi:anaerobic selenocysteine-containing dehydrogenase
VLDHRFIDGFTACFEEFAAQAAKTFWDDVLTATGLSREEIERVHAQVMESGSVIVCWRWA